MSDGWDLRRITDAFAKAAAEPTKWASALDVIARETGSVGAVVLPIRGRTPFVPLSQSLENAMETYFRDGWHTRDTRYLALGRIVRNGVGVDFDYTTENAIRTDTYYQEFLARFGLKYFGGVRISAADDLWCLAIQRSPAQGPFGEDEQRRLASLGERLSGAATLGRALGFAHVTGLADGLEHAGVAAILVDRQGCVVRLNQSAERLLGSQLMVRHGHLVPADASIRAPIERMIGAALGLCGIVSVPLPVAIPRPSGRALVVHAVPLTGDAILLFAPARAVVLIRDLDELGLPLETHLRSVFGLTSAEARMAIAIAAGDGMKAVAECLRISTNTAHSQLAAVFAKTGTNRQAELVRVLCRLATLA